MRSGCVEAIDIDYGTRAGERERVWRVRQCSGAQRAACRHFLLSLRHWCCYFSLRWHYFIFIYDAIDAATRYAAYDAAISMPMLIYLHATLLCRRLLLWFLFALISLRHYQYHCFHHGHYHCRHHHHAISAIIGFGYAHFIVINSQFLPDATGFINITSLSVTVNISFPHYCHRLPSSRLLISFLAYYSLHFIVFIFFHYITHYYCHSSLFSHDIIFNMPLLSFLHYLRHYFSFATPSIIIIYYYDIIFIIAWVTIIMFIIDAIIIFTLFMLRADIIFYFSWCWDTDYYFDVIIISLIFSPFSPIILFSPSMPDADDIIYFYFDADFDYAISSFPSSSFDAMRWCLMITRRCSFLSLLSLHYWHSSLCHYYYLRADILRCHIISLLLHCHWLCHIIIDYLHTPFPLLFIIYVFLHYRNIFDAAIICHYYYAIIDVDYLSLLSLSPPLILLRSYYLRHWHWWCRYYCLFISTLLAADAY